MKICSKCKQEKQLEDFHKDKYTKSGLSYHCKDCSSIKFKKYYSANIEQQVLRFSEWYESNKEHSLQYSSIKRKSIKEGVYLITNLKNGKKYVGQSVQPYGRRATHFSFHNTEKHASNKILQSDLKEYGKQSFTFEILEHCNKEELLEKEKYYINKLNPEYNL